MTTAKKQRKSEPTQVRPRKEPDTASRIGTAPPVEGRRPRPGPVTAGAGPSEEFPPQRVREAGRTAGEMPDGEITADDLTPETLLDSEPSRTPSSPIGRIPEDSQLHTAEAIGGGVGPDEAELATRDPVDRREREALYRRTRQHAADINFVEPHEAAELQAAGRESARGEER